MENENINKQNEILSKAKESIYKFQKQFNNILNYNKTDSSINSNDENIMTFNPKKIIKTNKNQDTTFKKEEKENNNNNKYNITKISFSNENDFINNEKDNNNKDNINEITNNFFAEDKSPGKNIQKKFKEITEENIVLKNEINKLIDENRILNANLNKELIKTEKGSNKIKSEKKGDNLLKNNEIELILEKNKELSKQIKELNNRNRLQKKRNQDIEQLLKEKNNYITQIEQKLKEINTNTDKNVMFKTKYNQLLARFDIVNKELTQFKKNKNINEDLINENKKLKEELNNISLNKKDIDINMDTNINGNNKDEINEYQKKYKKLLDENKSLNEKLEKLKKEKIILKNTKYNNKFNIQNSPKKDADKNSNKIINELKFENNSLKDICSEVQNKNKELKSNITELQNNNESFKKKYLEDIEKLQKEIIDFKQKELKEKNELKYQIKLLTENPANNTNKNINIELIDLRNQVKELIQYKNKCNILEEKNSQLKLELRKNKQIQIQEKPKLIPNNNKETFKISNKQSLIYKKSIFNKNEIKNDKRETNEKYIKLNKRIGELLKKNEDLSKENDKLDKKKNELIQQVNNLNDLIDLNNKDLVNKILELQKVIEVLNKELNIERDKNYFSENKIIKLEKKINKQIDEVSEREEMSLKKDSAKSGFENNNNNNNNKEVTLFSINEEQNDLIENYKNQIVSIKNENNSLINTINNLKNEIRIYQLKSKPDKKNKENKEIVSKDDEDLIKNITNEMNKWKKEYYNLTKINDILKDKLSKYEKNMGVDDEIKYLKDSLYKKDKLLMDLTLQIKEYQSKSDDIILGKTNKNMEKQIEILLNEVKGIRKRLLNIVTFNDRINNFDDFINNIEIIQNSGSKIKDKEVKKAVENLKLFLDEYKLCNDMAYNEFLVKLYSA